MLKGIKPDQEEVVSISTFVENLNLFKSVEVNVGMYVSLCRAFTVLQTGPRQAARNCNSKTPESTSKDLGLEPATNICEDIRAGGATDFLWSERRAQFQNFMFVEFSWNADNLTFKKAKAS